MKLVIRAPSRLAERLAVRIRPYYYVETENGVRGSYGSIIAVRPGRSPLVVCQFPCDLDPGDINDLFWLKMSQLSLSSGNRSFDMDY